MSDIDIIYQDHHLLIVNKPAGLVIHPTYKHADGTLWDALLIYLSEQGADDWSPQELPDESGWEHAPESVRLMLREKRQTKSWREEGLLPRPALLHRLDKDTSGIVALARTARACRHIARQFNTHTLVKTYLAVAKRGSPAWTVPRALFTATVAGFDGSVAQLPWPLDLSKVQTMPLTLDGSLQRDPADRRRCIVGSDGQQARTQVRVLAQKDDFFLLQVSPLTGRTHQIRAHLAAAGYALVGDPVYSSEAAAGTPESALSRQFLHASRLTLRDYPANQLRTFYAPLSPDLSLWLDHYFPAGIEAMDETSLPL